MKLNKIFNHLVLCHILLILALLNSPTYGGEKNHTEPAASIKTPEDSLKDNSDEITDHKIIVYYLHGESRCATCRKIEKYTIEAINGAFEKELSAGTIQIKVINIEEKENTHFAEDYKLITKSVIVSEMGGGNELRWKNLEKIWEYVLDEEGFKKYIIYEVKAYL